MILTLMLFSSYLEAKGYRILLAIDGQQAIDLAKAEHPDLILMVSRCQLLMGLKQLNKFASIPI
ncbi:circadian input kinase A [Pseudanabaena sp. lw0831]|nr:circadian input kinase A [Pseudanabaena sp. lw0831]